MNINLWDKIKIGFAAMFGGVAGLVKELLDQLNDKVLSHLNPETAKLVCNDVIAVNTCLKTILENHSAQMSAAKKAALVATVNAIDELAKALADCRIEPEELDAIIDSVKAAINAWKAAK